MILFFMSLFKFLLNNSFLWLKAFLDCDHALKNPTAWSWAKVIWGNTWALLLPTAKNCVLCCRLSIMYEDDDEGLFYQSAASDLLMSNCQVTLSIFNIYLLCNAVYGTDSYYFSLAIWNSIT